jgi:N-acetylglucosaminyldiphosphoundecaprenol N-acetyl-beta-D-mannosaminyltransferase
MSVDTEISTRRMRMMGAPIDAVTDAAAVRTILDAALAHKGHWTITANLDHLRRYRTEHVAKRLLERADLVLADGMPLVWASRLAGTPLPERVAGSDMIWLISRAAGQHHAFVFLLGGDPGVADRAAQVLRERCEGLEIVGTLCPPIGFERDEGELDRIQSELEGAAPQIVFVGLGFPKQDLLIERLRGALPEASFIGVGISFSFVAGEVTRAPRWMHALGLEWLHRLRREPRRLVRRYLIDGLPYALVLLASAMRHRFIASDAQDGWGWEPPRATR